MASKIHLSFDGQGYEALVDLATGQVHRFVRPEGKFLPSWAEETPVLAPLGGQQYYGSLSGLSGAGWVPARPGLEKVGYIETSVARPEAPKGGKILDGALRVVDLSRGRVVVIDHDQVHFLKDREIPRFLEEWGQATLDRPMRPVELTSWVPGRYGSGTMEELKKLLFVSGKFRRSESDKLSERRVLELLFWEELAQPERWEESSWRGAPVPRIRRRSADAVGEEEPHPTPPSSQYWLEGLGLGRGTDGRLYHTAGGLFRRPVEGELDSREAVEQIAPWAKVVDDDLGYLAERYVDGYPVHGLTYTPRSSGPGEEDGRPRQLDPRELALALMGKWTPPSAAEEEAEADNS